MMGNWKRNSVFTAFFVAAASVEGAVTKNTIYDNGGSFLRFLGKSGLLPDGSDPWMFMNNVFPGECENQELSDCTCKSHWKKVTNDVADAKFDPCVVVNNQCKPRSSLKDNEQHRSYKDVSPQFFYQKCGGIITKKLFPEKTEISGILRNRKDPNREADQNRQNRKVTFSDKVDIIEDAAESDNSTENNSKRHLDVLSGRAKQVKKAAGDAEHPEDQGNVQYADTEANINASTLRSRRNSQPKYSNTKKDGHKMRRVAEYPEHEYTDMKHRKDKQVEDEKENRNNDQDKGDIKRRNIDAVKEDDRGSKYAPMIRSMIRGFWLAFTLPFDVFIKPFTISAPKLWKKD